LSFNVDMPFSGLNPGEKSDTLRCSFRGTAMENSGTAPGTLGNVRFRDYEVDVRSGELRKRGLVIKLQGKPFQLLVTLLGRPRELVTREELRHRLWPSDAYVDFERSINIAIHKVRVALNDLADRPRYIETLARRGYRFIAPVQNPHALADQGISGPQPRLRLVVLPFENMNMGPDEDWFSEGLMEETIAQLGHLHPRQLAVIARSSAMRYKGSGKPVEQIGEELQVGYVVTGTVRRAAGRVRLAAELIQVSDQTSLWVETFEHELADPFTLQSRFAKGIAEALEIRLPLAHHAALQRVRPANLEAREAYLKGRHFWNKRTEEGLKKSLEYFQRAIEADPRYALAYVGLADANVILGNWSMLSPADTIPQARAAARKALEIDPQLAEPHAALGWAKFAFDRDWKGSDREFNLAIEQNPNYALARHWYSHSLAARGLVDAALDQNQQALELDALSVPIISLRGWLLFCGRRYHEAIQQCLMAMELDPYHPAPHGYLSMAYTMSGRLAEGIAEGEKARHSSGDLPMLIAFSGHPYAVAGDVARAEQILHELEEMRKKRYVPSYWVALIHAGLGRVDQAFESLQAAYSERSDWVGFASVDPRLDSLRSDPRFAELKKMLGLDGQVAVATGTP
jgi:TolB-like protein